MADLATQRRGGVSAGARIVPMDPPNGFWGDFLFGRGRPVSSRDSDFRAESIYRAEETRYNNTILKFGGPVSAILRESLQSWDKGKRMERNKRNAQPIRRTRLTRAEWEARRRRRRLRRVRNWVIFLSVCAALVALMTSAILWLLPRVRLLFAGPEEYQPVAYDLSEYIFPEDDPYLVLVNGNLPLEQAAAPALAETGTEGVQMEQQAAAAWQEMAAAARKDGVELVLMSGYQDEAARQAAYDGWVQYYLDEGLSAEEAEALARTVVPEPDCNESGTGLAAEILSDGYDTLDTGFDKTQAYRWLTAYAAEYGFILRWPADRQIATGMAYQPWHWRYVGPENARAIRASGLSLEEFLALYQQTDT